ncbi:MULTISPECIES: YciI family protein [Saccharothrix]|uniref:YciI family protein n=1 Tax=Saccharothrix TaxID=2071 RepID=UPI00093CF443|nr:YciI family protein [Saccharothrix sp. CB00851]OKI39235.1 hypothetical protein A6A25_03480 [Saccharothrix sp. CB00851]
MARFAVELVFGDNRDERLAVRPAHREYVATLVERGVVLAAGPYADETGALLVYEVADEAELREVLAADPYTPADVIKETRVHEWQTLLGAWL